MIGKMNQTRQALSWNSQDRYQKRPEVEQLNRMLKGMATSGIYFKEFSFLLWCYFDPSCMINSGNIMSHPMSSLTSHFLYYVFYFGLRSCNFVCCLVMHFWCLSCCFVKACVSVATAGKMTVFIKILQNLLVSNLNIIISDEWESHIINVILAS